MTENKKLSVLWPETSNQIKEQRAAESCGAPVPPESASCFPGAPAVRPGQNRFRPSPTQNRSVLSLLLPSAQIYRATETEPVQTAGGKKKTRTRTTTRKGPGIRLIKAEELKTRHWYQTRTSEPGTRAEHQDLVPAQIIRTWYQTRTSEPGTSPDHQDLVPDQNIRTRYQTRTSEPGTRPEPAGGNEADSDSDVGDQTAAGTSADSQPEQKDCPSVGVRSPWQPLLDQAMVASATDVRVSLSMLDEAL
ncbi:uncharacterized protein LOC116722861 [Xiphophorus hellerii]|uniref:uncharacterized protein LOC116722861 n=1 Tax=Xiphophorus hellerii TaxID=8084 RepID=UPI0013B42CFC|nr:uncharacterized protein LOC116722861 [Xiphophorus hellerii]